MKQMKKLLFMILCVGLCLSLLSGTSFADDVWDSAVPLVLDETTWISFENYGDRFNYVLTPQEDGFYKISFLDDQVEDWCEVYLYLYDSNGEFISSEYRQLSARMVAGETYYLSTYCNYSYGIYSYPILWQRDAEMDAFFSAMETAETIVDGELVTAEINGPGSFVGYSYSPAAAQNHQFTIDADSAVKVMIFYDNGKRLTELYGGPDSTGTGSAWLNSGNTYYIGVKLDGGSSANIRLKVQSDESLRQERLAAMQNAVDITSGTTEEVHIQSGGEIAYFRFVPSATETYYYWSDTNNTYLDTYGFIYNSNGDEIASDYYNGDNGNFKIVRELTAGETYYLAARFYSTQKTGSFTISLMNQAEKKADWQTKMQTAQPIILGDQFSIDTNAKDLLYFCFTPSTDDRYCFWSNYYEVYLYDDAGEQIDSVNSQGGTGVTTHEYDLVAGEKYYFNPRVYYYGTEDPSQVELTLTVKLTGLSQKLTAMQQNAIPIGIGETKTLDMGNSTYFSFVPETDQKYTIIVEHSFSKYSLVCSVYDSSGNDLSGGGNGGQGSESISTYLTAGNTYYFALESLLDMGEVSVTVIDNTAGNDAIVNADELSVGETVKIPAGETRYFKVANNNDDNYGEYHFFSKNQANTATAIRVSSDGSYDMIRGFHEPEGVYSYLNWSDYLYGDAYFIISCGECLDGDGLELTLLRTEDVRDLLEIESADGQTRYVVPKGETVDLAVTVGPEWLQPVLITKWSSHSTWTEEDNIDSQYYWQDTSAENYDPFRFTTAPVNENRQYVVDVIFNYYEKMTSFAFSVDYERADGYTGDQITWELSQDGTTLTLSGSGEMWDYFGENAFLPPWSQQVEGVTRVVVGEGITSIGSYAFQNMTNLADVSLPSSVTHIDSDAFTNCLSLKSIQLPASLQAIRRYAFYGSGLESIELPDGVTSVGPSVFMGCSSLRTVEIPASVTSIGDGCFAGCEELASITFLGDAPSIANNAFSGVTAYAWYDSQSNGWDGQTMTNYGGSLTWKSIDERLAAPTNLRWGWCPEHSSFGQIIPAHDENGMISFTANEPGYHRVVLYRVGEAGDEWLLGSYVRAESAGEDLAVDSFVRRAEFYGSGSYYFTVEALGADYNSNVSSGVVRSDTWTYVMPDAKLAAPNNVRWVDGQIVSWDAPQDDSHIQYYMLYSAFGEDPTSWRGIREIRVEPGVTSFDLQNPAAGWYSMAVMAWSDDITVALNSNAVQLPNLMVADSVFPGSLDTIETEAFENSGVLFVDLPAGTTGIQSRAFANCATLKAVRIPSTVTNIAADAFEGAENLVLYVEAGSYAENYAIEHELRYQAYDPQ